ncbi:hypothetical protein GCM10010409_39600 [Mycolicibacterium diernhoferi]
MPADVVGGTEFGDQRDGLLVVKSPGGSREIDAAGERGNRHGMRVRTGTDKFRCHSPNDEIMRGWRGFPQDRGMNRLPAALIDTLS